MDLSKYRHTDSIAIGAPREVVYELVADIAGYGAFSPVCTGGSWDDEAQDWFTGSNANGDMKWDTRCRVDIAVPGEEFAFTNCGFDGGIELVAWSFALEPDGDATVLVQTWEVLPAYEGFIGQLVPDAQGYLDGVVEPTRAGMAATLAAMKAAAEG